MLINFNKSNFLAHEVTYLGYVLNSEGIKADLNRIEHLPEFIEKPRTKKKTKVCWALSTVSTVHKKHGRQTCRYYR